MKILTTPKKNISVIAFRIAVTLDVKIGWFGRQVAVCVKERHKHANFRLGRLQKFNFACLLLMLLICSSRIENIFSFVCPLRARSSGMISGTQINSTLFLASSDKSKNGKSDFSCHCSLTQLFHDAEKLRKRPKKKF